MVQVVDLDPGDRIELPEGLLTVAEAPGFYTGVDPTNPQKKVLAIAAKNAMGRRRYVRVPDWKYKVLRRGH